MLSWDHVAHDEAIVTNDEDASQQPQRPPQQQHHQHQQPSLDQLAAIVAADRENPSIPSILQYNNPFSTQDTTRSFSVSGSVQTPPGPTINAATIRWFGLLAHDAVRSTPELPINQTSAGGAGVHITENEDDSHDFRPFFFPRLDEDNLDLSRITPLERATRIVDQQQHLHEPAVDGDDIANSENIGHTPTHPFEEQLWQSEKSIQLLSREYLLFEHFVRRVSQWVCCRSLGLLTGLEWD